MFISNRVYNVSKIDAIFTKLELPPGNAILAPNAAAVVLTTKTYPTAFVFINPNKRRMYMIINHNMDFRW